MAGPWDNVQLAGPPNGPAYINSAMNAAQTLGNLVNNGFNQYQNQQNFQYQQQQRNFFQDPNNQQMLSQFMQQPNQQNYGALMQKMAQTGGLQTAGPLIDQYLGISQDQSIANRIGGGQPNPTPPAAGSPAQIDPNYGKTNQPNYPPGAPYASPQSVANNNEGPDTTRSAIAELAGGREISNASIRNYATAVGAKSPESPLNEQQYNRLRQIFRRPSGDQEMASPATNTNNPVQPSGTDEQETGKATAGSAVQGGPPISPVPTTGAGKFVQNVPQNAQPRQPNFNQRFDASFGNQPGTRPSPLGDMNKVNALNVRIQQLRADEAAYSRRSPKAAEAAGKAADDAIKERDRILESISKFNEPGRETRDIESGAAATKIGMESEAKRRLEIEKGNIEEGRKNLTSINKTGDDYRLSNQKVQLAKSLLMSPDFYSGPAEGINRSFKQWTATLGGDPNKGTPQEAFNKTVSDLLSEQIRTMASSGVGRVLLSEVQQMQKGIASLGVTPASNRLLLEEVDRVQQAHIQVQNLAHQYLQNHEYLDPNFDKQVANYFTQHPLFNERELRNPKLIAPARMPQNIAQDPVRIKQWARENGLRSGDPFAGQDGSGPYKLPAI